MRFVRIENRWPWPALVDRFTVWRYGSVAIWLRPTGVEIVSDRAFRGTRPWVVGLPPKRNPAVVPQTLPMAPHEPVAAED
jgi:competence protein ComEC